MFNSILSHSHKILKELIFEAKKAYQDAQQNLIRVFVAKDSAWRLLATRSKRSLGSIILDPGMKDTLIEDAKDFLSCKAWYAARGIPFRRGYLLVSDLPPFLVKIGSPYGISSIAFSTALLEQGRQVSSIALRGNLDWMCT